MELFNDLFVNWKLDTWANILEVIGFIISSVALIVSFRIKSEVNRIKSEYMLDKTIKLHIIKLKASASQLNSYLNNYDNNRELIKTEFGTCQTELEDLITKLNPTQNQKSKKLVRFIKRRKILPFAHHKPPKHLFWFRIMKIAQGLYLTTYDDTWIVYNSVIEIIRQMENIMTNNKKALKHESRT